MSNGIVVLTLTALLTAAVIGLIVFAVRLTRRPRNTLIGGTLSPELIDQILHLKTTGQLDQAVFLIRGQTGMSHRAASRLLRRLRPAPG